MQKVAIVGGGAAGMGAAFALVEAGCEVTLFEAGDRLGGNCFGVDVPLPAGGSPAGGTPGGGFWRVDGGVRDYNRAISPRFDAFLDRLGLDRVGVVDDATFMTPRGDLLWHVRRGDVRFQWPVASRAEWTAELERFRRQAVEVLDGAPFADWTTRRYLEERGYSQAFRRLYVYPQTAACVPMPDGDPGRYPIRRLVAAWRMLGLVGPAAQRRCVAGGMHRYCQAFARWLTAAGGRLRESQRVVGVARGEGGVTLRALGRDGTLSRFAADEIVLAIRPDLAIDLLDDATAAERLLAAACDYRHALVVVHQDESLMPRARHAWGAFNYVTERRTSRAAPPAVTLYPNLFTGLGAEVPDVFVSVNPHREPDARRILDQRMLIHPASGRSARNTAQIARRIQGRRRTWFCGSYLREPYLHEQALETGLEVAERLLARVSPAGRQEMRAVA